MANRKGPGDHTENLEGSGGNVEETEIERASTDGQSKARFEIYRDQAGEWRWRLVHDNGNVIADSGEGYDRKAGAQKGMKSVKRNAGDAPVVVIEE